MKEYHLIRKNTDTSHEVSEVDTLLDNFHQENENSLHESSESVVNTAKSTFKKLKRGSKRSRKATVSNDESDSDFELPAYSTKNTVKGKRTFRPRKNNLTSHIEEDLNVSNSLEEDSKMVAQLEEAKTFKEPMGNFDSDRVISSKRAFRKVSTDSTHEGSQSGKKRLGVKNQDYPGSKMNLIECNSVSNELKDLSQKNRIKSHINNFEILIQASKLHTSMLTKDKIQGHTSEEFKQASVNGKLEGFQSILNGNHDLNSLAGLLYSQNLNSQYNGFGGPYTFNNHIDYFNLH